MIGRILFVIGGFLIVYSGISVILNRFFHYFGQIVVLSESYFSIGILIILLGIGFIYLGSTAHVWRKVRKMHRLRSHLYQESSCRYVWQM